MTGYLTGGLLTAMLVFQLAASTFAQDAQDAGEGNTGAEGDAAERLHHARRPRPGQFNFLESDGGGRYRLTGKNLKKFIGQPVEIVGGPPGKGVTFKTGLWPSPNVAAQAGAMDRRRRRSPGCPGVPLTRQARTRCPNFASSGCAALRGACQ